MATGRNAQWIRSGYISRPSEEAGAELQLRIVDEAPVNGNVGTREK